MPTFGEKLKALIATGRVANLPTVWSNVLIGFFLAWSWPISTLIDCENVRNILSTSLVLAALSATLLYLGGCLLGDCLDLEFDRKNRPLRPLPTGLLKFRPTITLAILSLIAGTLIGVSLTLFTPVLAALTINYAIFHKKSRPWALANMALCRAALILFSVSIATTQWTHPLFIGTALAVGLYTFFLSAVAATESDGTAFRPTRQLKYAMLSLQIIPLIILAQRPHITYEYYLLIGVAIIYTTWVFIAFSQLSRSKPAFVSRALAGFCLLDACIAATFSLPITLICMGLFALALLLQKITPAT